MFLSFVHFICQLDLEKTGSNAIQCFYYIYMKALLTIRLDFDQPANHFQRNESEQSDLQPII
jgi:hypothetical protein